MHDPHASVASDLCRESGGVELRGFEPLTPSMRTPGEEVRCGSMRGQTPGRVPSVRHSAGAVAVLRCCTRVIVELRLGDGRVELLPTGGPYDRARLGLVSPPTCLSFVVNTEDAAKLRLVDIRVLVGSLNDDLDNLGNPSLALPAIQAHSGDLTRPNVGCSHLVSRNREAHLVQTRGQKATDHVAVAGAQGRPTL
jgi:hypothetical protein